MIFCWLVVLPLSFLVPRKKGLIIIFGKFSGQLADNTKYFFLQGIRDNNKNVRFVTKNRSVFNDYTELNNQVITFPSFSAIYSLLRASFIIVDFSHWSLLDPIYFFLTIKSHKIHLWHGLTFKPVEKGVLKTNAEYIKARLFRRLVRYDAMISTSPFWTENLYKKYFLTKSIYDLGYPRNDVLFRKPDKLDLIGVNRPKFESLKKAKNDSFKIVIYAPTFRDDKSTAFSNGYLDFNSLNEFLFKNRIILILKFHPLSSSLSSESTNIISYDKKSDIYPLMSISDLLITDYSSIYIDYLIMNRPIIFFNYDYELYLKQDRNLQSIFIETIPGIITKTQTELEIALYEHLKQGKDEFVNKRSELMDISYNYADGNSASRIYNLIEQWQQ